jgi:hypothetical protein
VRLKPYAVRHSEIGISMTIEKRYISLLNYGLLSNMSGSLSKARSLPFSGKFFSVSESMSISLINVDHAAGQVRTEGKKKQS